MLLTKDPLHVCKPTHIKHVWQCSHCTSTCMWIVKMIKCSVHRFNTCGCWFNTLVQCFVITISFMFTFRVGHKRRTKHVQIFITTPIFWPYVTLYVLQNSAANQLDIKSYDAVQFQARRIWKISMVASHNYHNRKRWWTIGVLFGCYFVMESHKSLSGVLGMYLEWYP